MRPKRSGSRISTEKSNYTAEVLGRKCTLKKSLERKPAHLQDVLSKKNSNIIIEKEKSQADGQSVIIN